MDIDFLYNGILNGNRRALAKSITSIENNHPDCERLMAKVFPHTGKAHIVGVTGPPGAGKSTLVDKVAKEYRKRDKTIGIIAVDPTSPFTGGAILGDRIRMSELSTDKDIFIRSMGTRGHLGGLARSTSDAIMLMDAFGKDVILVETVGAGQSEVDIVENAHTTIIVEMPGLGDDIQAIKAGIFEIADLFVVNKADREGSDRAVTELQTMLEMGLSEKKHGAYVMHHSLDSRTAKRSETSQKSDSLSSESKSSKTWKVPVLKTVARENQGITEVVDTIDAHYEFLKENNLLEELRIASLKYEFQEILKEKLYGFAFDEDRDKEILADLESGKTDPYTAANKIISSLSRNKG